MAVNTLTILGCGATGNDTGLATSGYLLKTGEELTLLDCGAGVTAEFLRLGFDITKLARIVISHSHVDHVSDLAYMIQSIYLTRRSDPLEVYLPEDFVEPFLALLYGAYLIPERLTFSLDLIGYRPAVLFEHPFRLEAIRNTHLEHYADIIKNLDLPNKMLSHCLDVRVGGSRVFYSADLTSFDEIRDRLPGCAYVIIESTHIDLAAVMEFGCTGDIGAVVLTHLGDSEDIGEKTELIEKSGLEKVLLAEPGLVLEL